MAIFCTSRILLQLRKCMTIRELPHNEYLLILGKCDGQNIAPAFDEFTSGCKEKENATVNQIVTKMHCTSALFRDRPNVQHNSQTADFQAVEKESAPRSKFVKVALRCLQQWWAFSTPSEGVRK